MISLRNATVLLACAAMLALPVSWARSHEGATRLDDDRHGPVQRDYETSLMWYEKARAQGVPIATPVVQPTR